jgi:hypothetical protein
MVVKVRAYLVLGTSRLTSGHRAYSLWNRVNTEPLVSFRVSFRACYFKLDGTSRFLMKRPGMLAVCNRFITMCIKQLIIFTNGVHRGDLGS